MPAAIPPRRYSLRDQWAFRSQAWSSCAFVHVSLQQTHRQSDARFIALLNALRRGERLGPEQLALLLDGDTHGQQVIELSPIRDEVERKNMLGFQALGGSEHAYQCSDYAFIQEHHPELVSKARRDGEGKVVGCQEHRFPARLSTKQRMPVILLANVDSERGLVNGTQGRIVGYVPYWWAVARRKEALAESGKFGNFEEEQIVAWKSRQKGEEVMLPMGRFENGVQMTVFPVCQDSEVGDPKPFSVVARTQIPLLPAWAITIHKSQGMTLERAVVNLDHVFEPQMAYVALSRVRSLAGLKVASEVGAAGLQERGRLGGSSREVGEFMAQHFEEDRCSLGRQA